MMRLWVLARNRMAKSSQGRPSCLRTFSMSVMMNSASSALSGHGNEPDGFSSAFMGAQRLVPPAQVMADQGIGRVQDGGGAAVIFFQFDDGGIWKKTFEFQDIADLGPAPAVDGLVVVPHYADIVFRPHQMAQQAHLEAVGILEFIHGDIAEALLPRFPDVPVLLQQFVRQNQQVVKIHGILRLKFPAGRRRRCWPSGCLQWSQGPDRCFSSGSWRKAHPWA